ncbi:hypothetical protein WG66_001312 [Moniliophthora roreri]|nr:hypothetical protein WG66_001312 [Moniliophthora roreri]
MKCYEMEEFEIDTNRVQVLKGTGKSHGHRRARTHHQGCIAGSEKVLLASFWGCKSVVRDLNRTDDQRQSSSPRDDHVPSLYLASTSPSSASSCPIRWLPA